MPKKRLLEKFKFESGRELPPVKTSESPEEVISPREVRAQVRALWRARPGCASGWWFVTPRQPNSTLLCLSVLICKARMIITPLHRAVVHLTVYVPGAFWGTGS